LKNNNNKQTYQNMGCASSKGTLQTVDDSVHVMLKHDKKVQQKKGEKAHGYVPRAEHPMLREKPKAIVAAEDEGGDIVIPENGQ
jgi:hypothetical protein